MTDILGNWSFNGNGSTGGMSIFAVDAPGSLEVTVTFDGLNRDDGWTGHWDDSAKRITLTRALPGGATQDYIGFLGDNDPDHLIFGGSFTESDIPATAARTHFGWFAVWQGPIIF